MKSSPRNPFVMACEAIISFTEAWIDNARMPGNYLIFLRNVLYFSGKDTFK